jgi:hypothetical protein
MEKVSQSLSPDQDHFKTLSSRSPKAKTARSRGRRGCETQSLRIPYTRHCDGHCQALWLVTVIAGRRWPAVPLAVTCPVSSDRLIVMIWITDAIAIEEREVEESSALCRVGRETRRACYPAKA